MLRALGKTLWLAATPLALAVLLAEPSSLAGRAAPRVEPRAEMAEPTHEEHDANPIQNLSSWAYRGKNAEGGEWHEGEHRMPPPFTMQLLNFIVFAFLMGRMAGPSLTKAVRERHDKIKVALSEGARLRDQARAKLDEYDRKLAGLGAEIDALTHGIRAEADAEKKRIIAEAEARAERMQREAEQQIQAEMQQVRMTLEREAVAAAVAIAERLLADKTTDADQRSLADRFVKSLQDTAALRRTLGS
jgi:F-type H+-transporting ATPase subunit b